MKPLHFLPPILASLALLGASPVLADLVPAHHKVGIANDLSELKPADDPNIDYINAGGRGETYDLKNEDQKGFYIGFRIGVLRASRGKREWIRPIDLHIDSTLIKQPQGCREIILEQYRVTKALNDQIDGFNQAMWNAVIADIKKSEQAGADKPATKPAKAHAKIQPSTPTSKVGPR